jgi:hypothetical protein
MHPTGQIRRPVIPAEEIQRTLRRGWIATLAALPATALMATLAVFQPGIPHFSLAGLALPSIVLAVFPFYTSWVFVNAGIAMLHGAVKRGLLLLSSPSLVFMTGIAVAAVARHWKS